MNHAELVMPILSAGRHRNPRRGACFMEFASYLAGEKWSDHPPCTHPTLAALARDVNDLTSDLTRAELLSLVHRVVGLNSGDPVVGATVAARAAAAAIPLASMERQRALAAGLMNIARAHPSLQQLADEVLDQVPDAKRWGERYVSMTLIPRGNERRAFEAIVHTSVLGIAFACYAPDETGPDERLRELLTQAIADVETLVATEAAAPLRTPAYA